MFRNNARIYILAVLMSSLALVTACTRTLTDGNSTTDSASAPIPADAVAIQVSANSGLSPWIGRAAIAFNKTRTKLSSGKTAFVQISLVEAGQAVSEMAQTTNLPTIWMPDDAVWTSLLAERGNSSYQSDCVSIAQSPLIIAMWRPIAESLGWPGRPLGWLDIGTLAADPSEWAYYSGGKYGEALRIGQTHPGLSATGMSALLAVVQAARSKTDPVTAADVKDPIAQSSVKAFESAVASFSQSTDKLGETFFQRGSEFMAASIEYESTLINTGGSGDNGLVAIYPYEGTFMAKHPACINTTASPQQIEIARLFRDYLLAPATQQTAMNAGLRPADHRTTREVASAPLSAPFDAEHGVDPTLPKTIFGQQNPDAALAMNSLWQSARKFVNLTLLIDVSGSMRGEKIDNVRIAAKEFIQQMGDNDFLTLITFSDKISILSEHIHVSSVRTKAISQVNAILASGNTSLYDAIGTASGVIKKTTSSETSNVMVLLTDGQDTSSSRYRMNQTLITTASGNATTVFTIAYGQDADQDVLMKLASSGKGNFYAGNAANIAGIYQEMSAAFGGSVGIGR